jgi:predicted RNase H-like nuclease
MFVAGVDGCHGGWVSFKVDLASLSTSVELIDLQSILRSKPDDLAILAIDIPIGLLDRSRACDKVATVTPPPRAKMTAYFLPVKGGSSPERSGKKTRSRRKITKA